MRPLSALAVILCLGLWSHVGLCQEDEETAAAAAAADSGKRQFFLGLLKEGNTLAENGYYYEACVAFNGILERGEPVEEYYKEAEYAMAVNLHNLGLVYSSFTYFARIVDGGDTHPSFVKTLPWLVQISREVPGFQGVREYLAAYPPESFPPELKNEIAHTVGQFYYTQDDLDSALDALKLVDARTEAHYLPATYLTGAIHARRNKAKESLDAFKEVLRHVQSSVAPSALAQDFRSRAIMAIARIFYSTGDFDKALKYYDEIEKYSGDWLQALFEKSWTFFRISNNERAMGNLHTLNSPYFEEQYFPESRVLQAVILFSNCRFEDAIVVVDAFVREYDDLRKEMNTQLAQNEDPADFYYWLASLSAKGKGFSRKLKRIFNLALADKKLYRLFSFIVALDREEALLESMRQAAVQKDLAERLLGELVTYRELAIGETGEQARARLDLKRRELQRLVGQAMKVKFESLNALKEVIEGKREGAKAQGESAGWVVRRDNDHLAWPFDGEYWKDELDSYLFRVENLCPEAPKAAARP
jgi:tetratricopeptide (TPR) repeat protein